MGYMTRFRLDIEATGPGGEEPCPTCGQLRESSLLDLILGETVTSGYIRVEELTSNNTDSMKWYEHEIEMRALSTKYSEALFTLRGEGEEAGDVWVKYFLAGQMQMEKAEIKLAEFDPTKLR